MSLKEMFGVPENHSLVNIRYEEKGTNAHDAHWIYEERDEENRYISKIEYWDCASPGSLTTKNGYRKHDPAGKLIVEKLLQTHVVQDTVDVPYHLKAD